MTAQAQAHGSCRVTGAEKLPADSGGAAAICAAVERAVAAKAPDLRYSAGFGCCRVRARGKPRSEWAQTAGTKILGFGSRAQSAGDRPFRRFVADALAGARQR